MESLPLKSLYKYYSSDRGIEVLETGKRWWSLPHELNDPFDNQWGFQFIANLNQTNESVR